MKGDSTTQNPTERRSEPRTITDRYYSVEFSKSGLEFVYQFKIWNISSRGMCILVKEDSVVLDHLKVGDVLKMKYYTTESSSPTKYMKTKIKHITKDEKGRFGGHFWVGLSIEAEQDESKSVTTSEEQQLG
ncbi:MAG TPA: PilZ domain-containing protein [Desulfobacterales bacterium]|nr:PilZ domain-containing protein [Desulfobacterales bacterium]